MPQFIDRGSVWLQYGLEGGRSFQRINLRLDQTDQEDCNMFTTATYIGIAVTALAIEVDKYTRYTHPGLPAIAFAGVVIVIVSLAL